MAAKKTTQKNKYTMNNLTQAEEFLKEQVGSFEYPYDGASWLRMEKTLRRKSITNFLKWASGFAVFTAAVITTIYILPENQDNNTTLSSEQKTNIQITENNNAVTDNNTILQNNNQTVVPNNNNIAHSENNTPENNENGNTVVSVAHDSILTGVKNEDLLTRTHSKSPCPDFTMSQTSGCPPLSVQFIPAEKCDSMIYSWDFGDGKISTEKQPVHSFSKSGKYTVRLMVKYYRSEEIKTKILENVITVFSKPKASFDFITNKNTVYLQTKMTNHTFTWIANDTVSQGSTAERTFMKNQTHCITVIAQNQSGCSDTSTRKLEINEPLNVQMANAFTPDNNGLNEVFGPITENPAIIAFQLEIANPKGQTVYCKKAKEVGWNGINQQNNQPCEPGLYHYKLKIWDKYGNVEQMDGNVNIK